MKRLVGSFGTCILTASLFLLSSLPAQAATIVGGISFDDHAFADRLVSSVGTFSTSPGTGLEAALVGSSTLDYAFSFSPNAELVMAFDDNVVVNGAGNDLAIFELGVNDSFGLSIGGLTRTFTTHSTGFFNGLSSINVALIDLSLFGLAPGAAISQVRVFPMLNGATGSVPSFTVFGALHTQPGAAPVPEPTTLVLLGGAFMGLALRRRQR